jgi:hypothetical protein
MVFLGYRFIEEAWINLWPQENQPFGVIKHLDKISLILVFARDRCGVSFSGFFE